MSETLPLGDRVGDPTPLQPPHHDSVGRSEGGPGYPRHRDYSAFITEEQSDPCGAWLPTHEL